MRHDARKYTLTWPPFKKPAARPDNREQAAGLQIQKVRRIWYHTTSPWVDWEMPSLTKPNLA